MSEFFLNNFNTKLTTDEEAKFKKWVAERSNLLKRDVMKDLADYDLRGDFKSAGKLAENGHGTDRYKKPNHPTFSNQSVYHNTPSPLGHLYKGGSWDDEGYTPHRNMFLGGTHTIHGLKQYMSKVEPGKKLTIPDLAGIPYAVSPASDEDTRAIVPRRR